MPAVYALCGAPPLLLAAPLVLQSLTHNTPPVLQDIVWSADGLYLASASDGTVYTWHMEYFKRWVQLWHMQCMHIYAHQRYTHKLHPCMYVSHTNPKCDPIYTKGEPGTMHWQCVLTYISPCVMCSYICRIQ